MKLRLVVAVLACTSLVACGNDVSGEDIVVQDSTTTTNVEPETPVTEDSGEAPGGDAPSTTERSEDDDPTTSTSKEDSEGADEGKGKALTVKSGFSYGEGATGTTYSTAGALVTNPNKSLAAYEVTAVFNLLNDAGDVLTTESITVPYIPADETVPVAPLQIGYDIAEEPTDMSVDITGKFAEDEGWDGVDFMTGEGIDLEAGTAKLVQDDFGANVEFTVTNPSDVVVEYASWQCTFQDGKEIVGGAASSVIDPVVPDGKVKVDSSIQVKGLKADEITCRVYG